MQSKPVTRILPIIVISQFFCTSLWFTGNVLPGLAKELGLTPDSLGHLASSVQFGFITGTIMYTLLGISDRYHPSKVFFISAVFASLTNLSILLITEGLPGLMILRFLTGFFLAGIYPVGMKIASDHYGKILGKVLGFLVGALVLGTAFPHLIRNFSNIPAWRIVFVLTSGLALFGGILVLFIPIGPFRIASHKIDISAGLTIFRHKAFRIPALGYFGHMWELYTFWAFIPFILSFWSTWHPEQPIKIELFSFIIIASGFVSCISSGFLSQVYGSRKIAFVALFLSGICCCISPLIINMPFICMAIFLIFWGMVVIADSPMFSTLVAQNAPPALKGTAITMVTCIGFSITILSIECINVLKDLIRPQYLFLFLAPGPVFGLIALMQNRKIPQNPDHLLRQL